MRRHLRTDRMRDRAIIAPTARHFREAVAEVLTLADLEPLPAAAFLVPPLTDEQAAEWQRAWGETVVGQPAHRARIVALPSRTVLQPERPRKSTPRGLPRMRKHRRELLINALRSDGTLESTIQVQTCKAYRVLPWDLGLRPQNSAEEMPQPVTHADVVDAYREHVIEPVLDFARMSITDLFYNPDLLGTTNEPWPRHDWLKRLYRRITRKNGASS